MTIAPSSRDQNQDRYPAKDVERICKTGEKAEQLGQEILQQQQVKTTRLLKMGFFGISTIIGLSAVKFLWDVFGPKK